MRVWIPLTNAERSRISKVELLTSNVVNKTRLCNLMLSIVPLFSLSIIHSIVSFKNMSIECHICYLLIQLLLIGIIIFIILYCKSHLSKVLIQLKCFKPIYKLNGSVIEIFESTDSTIKDYYIYVSSSEFTSVKISVSKELLSVLEVGSSVTIVAFNGVDDSSGYVCYLI